LVNLYIFDNARYKNNKKYSLSVSHTSRSPFAKVEIHEGRSFSLSDISCVGLSQFATFVLYFCTSYSSATTKAHVSHPHKSAGNITVLYNMKIVGLTPSVVSVVDIPSFELFQLRRMHIVPDT
jgi:hypothetical protein